MIIKYLDGTVRNHDTLVGADLYEADLRRADLYGADLRRADLRGADLRRADLRGADLRRADLRGADLRRANLWNTIGNSAEITTIQTTPYTINITDHIVQIGCENHTLDEWLHFDDVTIDKMDRGALEWWRIWKPVIISFTQARINKC